MESDISSQQSWFWCLWSTNIKIEKGGKKPHCMQFTQKNSHKLWNLKIYETSQKTLKNLRTWEVFPMQTYETHSLLTWLFFMAPLMATVWRSMVDIFFSFPPYFPNGVRFAATIKTPLQTVNWIFYIFMKLAFLCPLSIFLHPVSLDLTTWPTIVNYIFIEDCDLLLILIF